MTRETIQATKVHPTKEKLIKEKEEGTESPNSQKIAVSDRYAVVFQNISADSTTEAERAQYRRAVIPVTKIVTIPDIDMDSAST
mmetsp:Transcript_4229/g.6069  ORF Transcript_4229/g.6069 Transcript_4229/m.6069 type:complete len:84 (-) Transcript_4229:897-1148(-)